MHKLFDITLIICFVLMTIIMQETGAQNCSNQHIESCTTAYYSTLRDSAGDIGAVCSVMNTYSECLQTLSDCNSTAVHDAIADANTTLYQSGCEIEAQNCSTKQILSCTTSYYNALREALRARNKEAICSVINTYMECLLRYSSHCNSNAVHAAIADANTILYQFGCETEAQNCANQHIENCTAAYYSTLRDSAGDFGAVCSVINTYSECLQTFSDCNSTALHEAIADANTTLYQSGCEIEAQNCSTKQITSCTTAYANAIRETPRTQVTICSAKNTYMECLLTYSSYCNSNAVHAAIANANTSLYQSGCEIETQNCSTKQITSCTTSYANAIRESPRNKEAMCSVINTYMECLLTYSSHCNSNAVHAAIANANMTLYQSGCETGAQNCSTQQLESCTTSYSITLAGSAVLGDREAVCRIINIYLECLSTYFADCNVDAGPTIDNIKMSLSEYGCNSFTSSLPAEETEAQRCSAKKMHACVSALGSVVIHAQEMKDLEKICSAGNIYLECVTKVGTDCSLDVGQTLVRAKKGLSQYGCVSDSNGTGSLVFNIVMLGLGFAFYTLLLYVVV